MLGFRDGDGFVRQNELDRMVLLAQHFSHTSLSTVTI